DLDEEEITALEQYQPRQKDGPAIPLPNDLENYMQGLERNLLIKALEDCNYNKTKAAEKLGISFRAMRYKLKKLGID
ncbi:helix-turn-helix domain-containing protein, partial [Cardiobacterium hominis]